LKAQERRNKEKNLIKQKRKKLKANGKQMFGKIFPTRNIKQMKTQKYFSRLLKVNLRGIFFSLSGV
jgi:hypothetical protein